MDRATAQDVARAGLDSPRLRIAIADFRAIGGDDAAGAQLAAQVRGALATQRQVEVVDSPQARTAIAAAETDILAQKPEAARLLGDQLGVDAVVYGILATDLGPILDEPVPLPGTFAQVVVAETLTLEGQLYPSPAVPLAQEPEGSSQLASSVLSLLPAIGRVLSIIESPAGVAIQLFPLGGRVLATDVEYGVYDPVEFRVAPGGGVVAEALARQDLRLGPLTGRVRTATVSDDHAISATATDPAGRVAVGQLVGLLPPAGAENRGPQLPLALLHTSPSGAAVFADSRPVGITPVALPLEPGRETTVLFLKRDYLPVQQRLAAAAGDALVLCAELQEIPPVGSLTLTTEPPGATAIIGDRELGKTPLTATNLPAQEHTLRLALDGYKPVSQAITIRRQRMVELSIKLERDFRTVRIVSEPEGARVALDGEAMGTTPLALAQVQTGQHEVRLTFPGHAIEKQTIRVASGEGEQTFQFRLRALAGNLRIETLPPGATVTLDGQQKGKTPLALTAMPIGQHQLTLSMDGYLPVTKTVDVQDQETTIVQEQLVKAEGSISVVSVPKGAKVTLDGQEMGVTPTTIEHVPVGMRVLALSYVGYRPWTARVPVAHGQTTKVEVSLMRESQVRGGSDR